MSLTNFASDRIYDHKRQQKNERDSAMLKLSGSFIAKSILGATLMSQVAFAQGVEKIELDKETVEVRKEEKLYRINKNGKTGKWKSIKGNIHLRRGTINPSTFKKESKKAIAADDLYIVQFDTKVLKAYRKAIKEIGGKILRYIPDQALLVRLKKDQYAELEQQEFVSWIGKFNDEHKISAALESKLNADSDAVVKYNVVFFDAAAKNKGVIRKEGGKVVESAKGSNIVVAELTAEQVVAICANPEVEAIDEWTEAETDMDIVLEISGANHVENLEGFSGEGVRGIVSDIGMNPSHENYQMNPPIVFTNSGTIDHGTPVYSIVFGSGAVVAGAKGVLPDGQGTFVHSGDNRTVHFPTFLNPTEQYRPVFYTASWGSGRTLDYTSISQDLDNILFANDIVMTQSQSNAGDQMSRPQAWSKNVVAIGGLQHLNTLDKSDDTFSNGSSRGPAADGRIKPDLMHFYDNIGNTASHASNSAYRSFGGTSGATPITGAYVGLFHQLWANGLFNGNPVVNQPDVFDSKPRAATARAMIINTAFQYDFDGPTHTFRRTNQGWGVIDIKNMYDIAEKNSWKYPLIVNEDVALEDGDVQTYSIEVTSASNPWMKVTMVYKDPSASLAASKDLVNDLNLRLTSPSGTVYWGNNGLHNGVWSVAGGSADDLNVVENVYVQNAEQGVWTVEVIGEAIVQDADLSTAAEIDARFALVVTCDGEDLCIEDNTPVSSSSEPVSSSSSDPVSSSSSVVTLPNFGDKSAPGRLEAEFFDAFNELTPGNNGNWADRNGENTGVDMEFTGDVGGGANVGWTDAGEWLEYNFDVAQAGSYEFVLRVASAQGTRNVSVSVNGAADQSFSYNGSQWQTYQDLVTVTANLSAGQNTVRVTFVDGATNLNYIDVNTITLSSSSEPVSSSSVVSSSSEPVSSSSVVSSSSEPVSSSSVVSSSSEPVSSSSSVTLPNFGNKSAPGRLEAEFFDAFNEFSPGNNGNWADRNGENTGVDMEFTGDVGGGANVGWTQDGEWLEYNFDVAVAGDYNFAIRVASIHSGRRVSLYLNGQFFGNQLFDGLNAWQTYLTTPGIIIPVQAGTHTLRVEFNTGDVNLNYIEVTSFGSSSSSQVSSSSEPVSSSSVVSSSSEPVSSSSVVSSSSSVSTGITGTEYDACVNPDGSVDVGVPGKSNDGDFFGGYLRGLWFWRSQTPSSCTDGVCNIPTLGANVGDSFQYFCQGGGCDADAFYPGTNNQPGDVMTLRSCE